MFYVFNDIVSLNKIAYSFKKVFIYIYIFNTDNKQIKQITRCIV